MKLSLSTNKTLTQLPLLSDNFVYLLSWGDKAIIVDPGAPVDTDVQVEAILITHHHQDHTAGIPSIDAPVIGPDDDRIINLSRKVYDGEEFDIGPFHFHVIETPGHTIPAVCYYLPREKLLFTGDTLFGAGCGRLFEGDVKMLWDSLNKLSKLPDDTIVLCGHDYILKNLAFARSLGLGSHREPSTLSLLGEEKTSNPFLNVDLETFIERRTLRDSY